MPILQALQTSQINGAKVSRRSKTQPNGVLLLFAPSATHEREGVEMA